MILSMKKPFFHKRNLSTAHATSKTPFNPRRISMMDNKQSLQDKSHKSPSLGIGLFQNHPKVTNFSNQFHNVWITPNEMMFNDTTLHTNAVKQEREARCLMVSLERQVSKMEKIREWELKDKLLQYYQDNYDSKYPMSNLNN